MALSSKVVLIYVQLLLWAAYLHAFQVPTAGQFLKVSRSHFQPTNRYPLPLRVSFQEQLGDLSSFTVPELKTKLKDAGLKVGGKKSELIERLQVHFESKGPSTTVEEEAPEAKTDSSDEQVLSVNEESFVDAQMGDRSAKTENTPFPSMRGSTIEFFDADQCELDLDEIYDMVDARAELRANREFKAADSLLEELAEHGVMVVDDSETNQCTLRYLDPRVTPAMLRARLRAAGADGPQLRRKEQLFNALVKAGVEADWDAPAGTCYVPVPAAPEGSPEGEAEFEAPAELLGRLIGRGGAVLRAIEEHSGCAVMVEDEDEGAEGEGGATALFLLEGPEHALPAALEMMAGALEEAKASARRSQREQERKGGGGGGGGGREEGRPRRELRPDYSTAAAEGGGRPDGNRVFVHNLPLDATWQDLKTFFAQAGPVDFANVAMNSNGESKGVGIVAFASEAGARQAVELLNDAEMGGRKLGVRPDVAPDARQTARSRSRDENPYLPRNYGGSPGRMDEGERKRCRVFVAGLPYKATWENLKDFFKENFSEGNTVYSKVMVEPDGRSKGCGVVQFETEAQRDLAIKRMHNADFWGQEIIVRADNDRPANERRRDRVGGRGGGGGGGWRRGGQ